MDETDAALLAEYVRCESEGAFRELVCRHIDLVYSVALRKVGGDVHLARDVVQLAFTDLARKARWLPRGVVLGGWLHRHTCFRASTVVRSEIRRRAREQKAAEMNVLDQPPNHSWERLAPLLDDALGSLPRRDCDAIVLRFFENRSLAEIGRVFGVTEDAAQKLVSRAVDKLRVHFERRGVTTSAASIAGALGVNSVHAAPSGLAISTTHAAMAAIASDVSIAGGLLGILHRASQHKAVVSAIVGAVALTFLFSEWRPQAQGRAAPVSMSIRPVARAHASVAASMRAEPIATLATAPGVVSAKIATSATMAGLPPLPPLGNTPPAQLVVDHMAAAYLSCRSYFDTGIIARVHVERERKVTREIPFATAFVRPDRFRFEFGDSGPRLKHSYVIWADQSDVRTWWDLHQPHERSTTLSLAIAGAVGISSGTSLRIASLLLPDRIEGNRPLREFLPTHPPEIDQIQGVDCFRLRGSFGPTLTTLWIERDTLLIRRLYTETDHGHFRSETTITYRPVFNADLPDELLHFDPPKR